MLSAKFSKFALPMLGENPTGLLNPLCWSKNQATSLGLLQVLVDGEHHVGSELLGSQAIATTDADDVGLGHGLQGGAHLQEERLTLRALLLHAWPMPSVAYGLWAGSFVDLQPHKMADRS